MKRLPILLLLSILFIGGCKKESETVTTDLASDYAQATPGKYITYRTDSLVFLNFGNTIQTNAYQEKFVVDAALTDNLGRPAYRVFRYYRDTTGTQPWKSQGTLTVTPLKNTFEVTEYNLRYLKIAGPITQGNTWKGNRYLPQPTYGGLYEFSNDVNMADWDYTMTGVGQTITLAGKSIPNVITIDQINESVNAPVIQPNAYGYTNRSVEQYAKGIGMVTQQLTMWEYQPPTSNSKGYRGFGVKRTMIDHN